MTTLHRLERPEGNLSYTDEGDGPVVVCLPGVGDLRSEYRHLAPQLLATGHRVVVMDLPGHGDADTTFTTLDRPAVGDHVVALLDHLDAGPAHVIGCSLGASAAIWAAAAAPARVASVTLIGAFARDPEGGLAQRLTALAMRAALTRPWGPAAWTSWFGRLFPGARPDDLADQQAAIRANLREPGRLEAMRRLGLSSCAEVEPRLADVKAPSLVVMGTADPDWPDATAEARWLSGELGGDLHLAEGAGHYPHVEQPEATGRAILAFLQRVSTAA